MSERLRWACLAGLLGLWLAGAASAESAPSIAVPGDCAQSERELATSPAGAEDSKSSGDSRSVGGSPGDFFDPGEGDGGLPGLDLPGSTSQSASASGPGLLSPGAGGLSGLFDPAAALDPPLDPPMDPGLLTDLLENPL